MLRASQKVAENAKREADIIKRDSTTEKDKLQAIVSAQLQEVKD